METQIFCMETQILNENLFQPCFGHEYEVRFSKKKLALDDFSNELLSFFDIQNFWISSFKRFLKICLHIKDMY